MRKFKNIFIIAFIFLVFLGMFPSSVHAELTKEQRKTVTEFARNFINEGNSKKILRYDQGKRDVGFKNMKEEGKMYFDCSSFVCFIYNQTCKAKLGALTTSDIYASSKFKKVGKYNGNNSQLEPGDLLCRPAWLTGKGHVVLYLGGGKIAHAAGQIGKGPTEQVVIGNVYSDSFTILRYKGSPKKVKSYAEYTWPDGTASNWKSEGTKDFDIQGTQQGTFNVQSYDFDWLIKSLKQILDWFIGITTYLIRIVFLGWASIFEIVINNIAGWIAGEDMSLTIEKLVNNKVPLLDVNFFDFATAGGEKIQEDSVIYVIRSNVANIYYIMRTISIIGLLVTLLYLGIRMTLSTIAEEKAKYKEMLISWLVSFIIVFFIHYLMILILNINQSLIELIHASFAGGEESLYDSVRASAYVIQASVGWPALVMYMCLIYLLIRFLFIYIKRLLVVAILTFMAPILGVTYSIDKIKDNKSQSLSNWLKEYTFNVIIQSVHALLYTLFVSLAFNMMGTSILGAIFAFLLINFIFKAEVIFKKIFAIQSGSIKDAINSAAWIMGASRVAKSFVKANVKAASFITKPVQKPVRDIVSRTKEYRKNDKILKVEKAIESAREQGKTFVTIGRNKYNIGQVMNYTENNLDSKETAARLFEKHEEIKKSNKAEAKARMSQTLHSVLGTAQAVSAIPMTIVDGSEGVAMASNARNNLNKGINQHSKKVGRGIYDKRKRYTGKNKVVKFVKDRGIARSGLQLATLGMYGNMKNIKALNEEHVKKVKKAIYNTQHQVAISQLEESIYKQYQELTTNPNIDRNELEDVIESTNKTVPKESIQKVIYRIAAMRQIEILVKSNKQSKEENTPNNTQEHSDSNKRASRKPKEAKDRTLEKGVTTISRQVKDLDNLTSKVKKSLKYDKKDIRFNEERFNKAIDRQMKDIIAKQDKIKRYEISEEQIKEKFNNLTEGEREELIRNAIFSAITVSKDDRERLKKQKSGTKLEGVFEIIDKLSEEKKVSLKNDIYKQNFKDYISEEVATTKKKKKEDVQEKEIDDYLAGLTNEDLIQKVGIVGSFEDSIQRHESTDKPEYADLVRNIRELRHHKEQLKG